MRLRRNRRTPQATQPTIDVDVKKVIREEFARTDAVSGPTLIALARRKAIVTSLDIDAERGSAVIAFDDGTRVRVASGHPDLPQLKAAAKLVATRLTLTTPCQDGTGRLLVFTGAHWTIYLTVDSAVIL